MIPIKYFQNKKKFYLSEKAFLFTKKNNVYEQDDPLNQPNPEDKDTENPDIIKKESLEDQKIMFGIFL